MKLILITDLHAGPADPSGRSYPEGIRMLESAVRDANHEESPDGVLLGGDWIHDPDGLEAGSLYQEVRAVVDELKAPWLIIPGNHDMVPGAFYRYFPRPSPIETIGSVRVVTCLDEEAPDWCATRSTQDCARFEEARRGWDGDIISFQHMSFHPPGATTCRFNLTNAREVIEAMLNARAHLSLSGHHHDGFHCTEGPIDFICGRALCESGGLMIIERDVSGRIESRFRTVWP